MHLFAGIGGGILGGMLLGHECVCAVEIDNYCRQVLKQRQTESILPPFPIHDDIRTFDARPWRGRIDIVCGGFPCQPWSSAGKRRGAADPRHLWPEMARVISECRPEFVFAENVSLAAFRETLARPSRVGLPSPASSLPRCSRCWGTAPTQSMVVACCRRRSPRTRRRCICAPAVALLALICCQRRRRATGKTGRRSRAGTCRSTGISADGCISRRTRTRLVGS